MLLHELLLGMLKMGRYSKWSHSRLHRSYLSSVAHGCSTIQLLLHLLLLLLHHCHLLLLLLLLLLHRLRSPLVSLVLEGCWILLVHYDQLR